MTCAQVASYVADTVVSAVDYAVDEAGKLVESAADFAEGVADMASALENGEPYVVHSEKVWLLEQHCHSIVHPWCCAINGCGPTISGYCRVPQYLAHVNYRRKAAFAACSDYMGIRKSCCTRSLLLIPHAHRMHSPMQQNGL